MAMHLIPGLAAGAIFALSSGDTLRVPAGQADACAFLTKAEAEAITGQSIGPPAKGGSGECRSFTPSWSRTPSR